MAQDRSADIARLERDIGRLEDAENKAGEMLQENVILLEDLGDFRFFKIIRISGNQWK
ncbi:hypothetical protein [Butyrivibrio sp. X503]|uniref:hypothetical protein n=1 Tax=Butyrivibrio sp. X503 TaxID=2364878 RepID=UPI00131474E6|nr:hypothetical protein [Butyrivibrio sp. X503]